MLIAHISDCHISRPGEKVLGIADTAKNLSVCVDQLNESRPKPDVVLISGDITAYGKAEEASHAASLLAKLSMPYYVVPGNHDQRQSLYEAFKGSACPGLTDGYFNFVIDDFDLRILAIDSLYPGKPGGKICKLRAKWLDERLSESQKPTIIFMHHPPVKCGLPETDADGFDGVDLLAAVIEKHKHLLRILCGHIHREIHVAWKGTVVTTAASMGMHLSFELNNGHESQFYLDDGRYQLHFYTQAGDLVSHSMYLRELEGPFDF